MKKIITYLSIIFIILALFSSFLYVNAASPSITKILDSQMTYSGLTNVSYGGYLNGESFQQDGIVTYKGYQYTAFWNTNKSVVMAKRALPNGSWQKFEFTDYKLNSIDAHNTISIGICPNDGTMHLAFDHHGNDLHYRKSISGFLDNPTTHTWSSSSFSSVTNILYNNTEIKLVTYPKFITTPQGNMLLEYRYGESGSGDQYLCEYSGTSHSWTNVGKYIDGISDSINAYPHGINYSRNGTRLFMTWCWRETPDATTNHGLLFIYSDDNGRNWYNNFGNLVAKTGSSFITKNSNGIEVFEINQNRGLINQEHMTIDNDGNVHVLLSHMPDSQSDDSNFTNARKKSVYFHYYRNSSGKWTKTNMNFPSIENFRGKLAVSKNNNLFAILPNLRIASASSASNWSDWTIVNSEDSERFFSDPLIDEFRLRNENILSVYYPQKSSPNIYVLDYSFPDVTTPSPSINPNPKYQAYVLGYFTDGTNGYGLNLCYSTDALNWKALNSGNPVMYPTMGTKGIRDPFVFRKQDGNFAIVSTDMKGTTWSDHSQYIHLWDSKDLTSFNNEKLVKMHDTTMHTWAPEIFYDSSKNRYGIIWSGNTDYNRTYVNYTQDFSSFSTNEVFFDPGYDVIDSDVIEDSGTYYLFFKDERSSGKSIKAAKSSSLTPGSFNVFTPNFLTEKTEGPIVFKDNTKNTWYMFADLFTQGGIFELRSTNNLSATSWSKISNFSLPSGIRHGSIVSVTQDELNTIRQKWDPSFKTTSPTISPTQTSTIKIGDVNLDGKITSTDVSLIERHTLGISNLSDISQLNSDANKDGKITSSDISLIERLLLGLISSL